MNTKNCTKTHLFRTTAILTLLTLLFAALPVRQAGAVSLDITSVATGTWEATAWPSTQRSGTITVTSGSSTVTGAGTAFTTELSVGNIIKTNDVVPVPIGTVASIVSDTELTLTTNPATTLTDIDYLVQGVGPADHAIVDTGHTVTIAANAVNQMGTVTVNTGGTLAVSNPGTVFNILTVNGTVSATENVAFGELIVNSGGVVNAAGNGAYTASSLTINSGGTMNISRNFTVDSTTTIAGTISFSSTGITGRDMIFLGSVTLESGASWIEATTGNGSNNTYDFLMTS